MISSIRRKKSGKIPDGFCLLVPCTDDVKDDNDDDDGNGGSSGNDDDDDNDGRCLAFVIKFGNNEK